MEHHGRGSATPMKQDDFRAALDLLFALWEVIFKKRIADGFAVSDLTLDYTDLYAGGGTNPDTGEDGSPVIALAALWKFKFRTGHDFTATLYERNTTTYNRLVRNLGPYDPKRIRPLNKDNSHIIESLKPSKWQYGLVYSDSNNGEIPVDVLACFNERRPVTDFLVNVTCTGRKRAGARPLEDDLLATGKKHWYIRETVSAWQWTILLGTNWPDFPEPPSERRFYPLDSEDGQFLLAKCGHTKEQLYGRQLSLFDDLPAPTPYSTYEEYLKQPRYRAIRKLAMERVNYVCQQCKQSGATEVHHLRYPKWGEYDVPENLMPVCHACHCEIEGKEE